MSSPTNFQYPSKIYNQSNHQSNAYKFNPSSPSHDDSERYHNDSTGFYPPLSGTAPASPSNYHSMNQSASHQTPSRNNDSFQNYALLPPSQTASQSHNPYQMWNPLTMNSWNNQNRDHPSLNGSSINPMLSSLYAAGHGGFGPSSSNPMPFGLPGMGQSYSSHHQHDHVPRSTSPPLDLPLSSSVNQPFNHSVNQSFNPYAFTNLLNTNSSYSSNNQSNNQPQYLKYMDPSAAASQFSALLMGASLNHLLPSSLSSTDQSINPSDDQSIDHALARSLSPPRKAGRVFVCPNCNESLKTRFSLKRHMKKHTGEKPHTCPYAGCMKSFPEASTLKRHVRIHTGEKPFKCKFDCGKTFADATNVKRHEMTHTGEKPYKCFFAMNTDKPGETQYCGRCFSRGSSLKQHMASLHKCAPGLIASSVRRGQAMKVGDTAIAQEHELAINQSIKQQSNNSLTNQGNDLDQSTLPASQQLIDALLAEEEEEGGSESEYEDE